MVLLNSSIIMSLYRCFERFNRLMKKEKYKNLILLLAILP